MFTISRTTASGKSVGMSMNMFLFAKSPGREAASSRASPCPCAQHSIQCSETRPVTESCYNATTTSTTFHREYHSRTQEIAATCTGLQGDFVSLQCRTL